MSIETEDKVEVLWVRLENKYRPLTIGAFYAGKESIENKKRIYAEVTRHIIKVKETNKIMLAGDFNAKIEINTTEIKYTMSKNNKIMSNLLQQTNLIAKNINEHNKWTIQNRNKPDEKSVIHYIIMTQEVANNTREIETDDKGILTLEGKNDNASIAEFYRGKLKTHLEPMAHYPLLGFIYQSVIPTLPLLINDLLIRGSCDQHSVNLSLSPNF